MGPDKIPPTLRKEETTEIKEESKKNIEDPDF